MTILPAKRSGTPNNDNNNDANQQNTNQEPIFRRREELSPLSEATSNRRSQYQYVKNADRKERFRKRYKESDRNRERDREKTRDVRREQKRDRTNNESLRDINSNSSTSDSSNSSSISNGSSSSSSTGSDISSSGSTGSAIIAACSGDIAIGVTEPAPKVTKSESDTNTGYNSEDEYNNDQVSFKYCTLTTEEWEKRDEYFAKGMKNLGFEIKQMNEDGACLFRCIADQVYGDQDFHFQVRQDCMNYIDQNRDFFEPYVTEDFTKYISRKRIWNVHGNHLEIQAMSELFNRTIEVYCYKLTPINIFNCSRVITAYEPIRLSYHRMCHYNSISNPNKPSVGVGLGLPNYNTIDLDRSRVNDAVRASDDLLIEQTMLEDKLKATDWEATNEAIEEQVARESYIQYLRDNERRRRSEGSAVTNMASSTITSSMITSPMTPRRGSVSPKDAQSPKASSPKQSTAQYSPMTAAGVASPRNSPLCSKSVTTDSTDITKSKCNAEYDTFSGTFNSLSFETQSGTPFGEYKSLLNMSSYFDGAGSSSSYCDKYEDIDQTLMAQVLAESQQTYLNELKFKSKVVRHEPPESPN